MCPRSKTTNQKLTSSRRDNVELSLLHATHGLVLGDTRIFVAALVVVINDVRYLQITYTTRAIQIQRHI